MPPTKEKLVPLMRLPEPWSEQSGIPKQTVLRRLCEWAMCGGFPQDAFRDVHDQRIAPFDIYMSERALGEMTVFSSGISLGGQTTFNSGWGIEVLARVLVRLPDLELFCEATDTQPFWEKRRAGLFSLLRRQHQHAHLAPPPCPQAEAAAIRFQAKESADAKMNSMQANLNSLNGKDERWKRQMQGVDEGPIDFLRWSDAWATDSRSVLRDLEVAPDPDLAERLQRLDKDWETFRRENESEVAPAPAAVENEIQLRLMPAERQATFRGVAFSIPEKQFKLLHCLAEAALLGSCAKMAEIERRIWEDDLSKTFRSVSDVVRDLRNTIKAADESADPTSLIKNVARQGYLLNLSPSAIVIGSNGNGGNEPGTAGSSYSQSSHSEPTR